MATVDLTRKNDFHKKRGICIMALVINPKILAEQGLGVADTGTVGTIPPHSVVTSVEAAVVSANPSAGADVQVQIEGVEVADITDTTATVPDYTAKAFPTGATVTVASGSSTDVALMVSIEYIEYTKTTGEMTRITGN